jgi:PEP-CTERM motif
VHIIARSLLGTAAALTLIVSAGAARADVVISSFTESTFTVSGPGNNAFCSSGGTCDFKGGTGGNAPGSVNAPLLSSTSSASGLPTLAAGSPTIIGQNANVLQWWSAGSYNNSGGTTTVTGTTNAGVTPLFNNLGAGSHQLFSDTTFFPPGGTGSNDTSTFLTAEFKGTATVGAGNTLSFTGSVDDNVMIYYRTGTTGAYTLLAVSPTNLSNQAAFDFTSLALGAGTYQFEVFYADRSSTQASLTLDATVTAAVPEPSTWAMMILGFFGVGFLAYRKKTVVRFV